MRTLLLVLLLLLVAWLVCDLTDQAGDHDSLPVKAEQWGRETPPYVVAEDMFTTTTAARARTAPRVRATSASDPVVRPARYPTGCTAPGTFDPAPCVPASRPCVIPAYICARESGMHINVWNHQGSGASGKYQFMPSTWAGYGGYAHAAWAPEEVQDEKAAALWSSPGGPGHWAATR